MPESLNDRELDGWRPLLAIADMAGRTMGGGGARTAAVDLSEADDDLDDEPALMLLRTAARSSTRRRRQLEDEITSADLVKKLHALEDRPWNEWGRFKKPITANGVARLLKRYDIKPGTLGSGNDRPARLLLGAVRRCLATLRGRAVTLSSLPSAPTAPTLVAQGFEAKTQPLQRFWLERLENRSTPWKSRAGAVGADGHGKAGHLRKKTAIRTAVDGPQRRRDEP